MQRSQFFRAMLEQPYGEEWYLTIRGILRMKRVVAAVAATLCVAFCVLLSSCPSAAMDGPSEADPPAFTSSNHLLDLLVIAEPKTISLGEFHPTAWVFKICKTAVAHHDNCPNDSRTISPYGGVRLQLYPGDHLRMRLVNHLPPVPADAEYAHGSDPMMNEMLAANPVNIHTHGLIVEPRKADATDPTYGDYVYVLGYPAGKMPAMVPPDETATDKPIQYDIYIPPNHPPGVYWFHPHVHGLNINQLSEGLSGIITIGSPTDYVKPPQGMSTIPTRYFVLKDMQVLSSGRALDQESARFCSPFPLAGVSRNGFCQGWDSLGIPDERDERSGNHEGGAWFFTINGQVDPQIPMPAAPGELWRFLNAGASRSYDLVLQDAQTRNDIPFQVISLDGVTLAAPDGAIAAQSGVGAVGKAHLVPCPVQSPDSTSQPVCATHLVLFPSSRAEIWVFPQSRPAILKTLMLYTGSRGDRWPEASLAHIFVRPGSSTAGAELLSVKPFQEAILSPQGLLGAPVRASFAGVSSSLRLQDARQLLQGKSNSSSPIHLNARQVATVAARLKEISQPAASLASSTCSALPPGHRRRILFGVPSSDPKAFGLGYEEADENDNPVPGTFRDVAPFDPATINICLPLDPHNTPATEEWELVNLSAEAHNFHIHQTEFYVLPKNAPAGNAGALMDNVVLPNGGRSCDGSVATWRAGRCPVQTVVVKIPFAEVGDFIYHCHIGEHQDGGMMAHIRVISSQ
jgi:FtsP/CotA-like multicopper oxidase with cupredoxin domain